MQTLIRILVLLTLALMPGAAFAHAQLIASSPADNVVLAQAPGAVVLEFNEPVTPLVMTWIAPDGTSLVTETAPDGARVHVIAAGGTARGTHLLSWRVVSEDGHPIAGTLVFSVGSVSAGARGQGEAAPQWSARFAAAARYLLTVALVAGVGGAVFAGFVASPAAAATTLARGMALAVLPAAGLALGMQGLDLTGLGLSALLGRAPWVAVAGAPLVRSAGLAVAAALVARWALASGGAVRGFGTKTMALLAWLLAAASFAASGHAVLAEPRWVALSAITLHAATLIYWLGALVPLLGAIRGPEAGAVLRRFGRLAVPLVLVLLASGGVLALLQAGPKGLAALFGTAYGAVLGAKLALVVPLLGIALYNRQRLTPLIARPGEPARRALGHSICAEVVLGLTILALASAFRLTPPPRALRETPPAFAHFHGTALMVDLALSPGRVGQNAITMNITPVAVAPPPPREIEVELALPGRGIEPIRLAATPGDDGHWLAGPFVVPLAGLWEVTLRVLVTDFQLEALGATLLVAP